MRKIFLPLGFMIFAVVPAFAESPPAGEQALEFSLKSILEEY